MSYSSLPSYAHKFVEGTFSETFDDQVISDESDIGAGSFRALTTSGVVGAGWTYRAKTTADMETFREFVQSTVRGRLKAFYWTHQFDDTIRLVRFTEIPNPVRLAAGLYDFNISVKEI